MKKATRNTRHIKTSYTHGRNMFGEKAETHLITWEQILRSQQHPTERKSFIGICCG